jgi:hypothetical protein
MLATDEFDIISPVGRLPMPGIDGGRSMFAASEILPKPSVLALERAFGRKRARFH